MPKKWTEVVRGSELDGGSEDVAAFAGLEIPDDKSDAYGDLLGGSRPLQEFFDEIKHGYFEVVEAQDDQPPGLNDTNWVITTTNVKALRAELRRVLIAKLGLPMYKKISR